MSDNEKQLDWSDEQWNAVRRAVQETARKARVASSFLPLVGPLPASQTTVPALAMNDNPIPSPQRGETPERLAVDERQVLHFATISADVYLKSSEAADPDLAAAIAMFCRAADVVGRVEDAIIFNGQPDEGGIPTIGARPAVSPPIYAVHGGDGNGGLLGAPGCLSADASGEGDAGDGIVSGVVDAIQQLEAGGHYGPFVCVLGHGLFLAANTPNKGSLVLPSDRITPFLNGPLLRTSTIPGDCGLVVALAGEPIDLVVATDVSVKFLQLSVEPRYVFRVYERFVLRVKQPGAVCRLEG